MVRKFAWLGLAFFVGSLLSVGTVHAHGRVNKRLANTATRAIQIHQMQHIEEVAHIPLCGEAVEKSTCW